MNEVVIRDLSKLPKWASSYIKRLEGEVEHYKHRSLQVSGDEETNTRIKDFVLGDQNLPKGSCITFYLRDGEIDCVIRDDLLDIRTSSGFPIIIPHTSNNFYVEVRSLWKAAKQQP